MPALEVKDVRKEFPTRGQPLSVLRNISFELSAGQSLSIVGPSGSGKSTLLHILGTLDQPTSGSVRLEGQDPFSLAEADLAAFRNRRIGFVFQEHHLLPQCSALENVLLPTLAEREDGTRTIERGRELLVRVGLGDRLEHRPAELSGGERQRVAICRALVLRPTLVLADEPTGNLDRSTAAGVADLLFELQRDESTMLVIVTHSAELASRCERRTELDNGSLREWRP